jgi:hypothetical protein
MGGVAHDWLPAGKRAALCFSIDDIHPGRSADAYDGGGDRSEGALGRVEWLLKRHPQLLITLFVTADWRAISSRPTRRILASIPLLRHRVYLAKRWPRGTMRLDRHPEFVDFLKALPRTEIALHGLHHCHKGLRIPVEFQDDGPSELRAALTEMLRIFEQAGLAFAPGLCPPGWNAPPPLLDAMAGLGIEFLASARDIFTPISPGATAQMSGMKGVSLIYPQMVHGGRLLHIPANFHATCPIDRATAILDCGGLLSIKAHIVKSAFGVTSYDGLDEVYTNYLDVLLTELDARYGDSLWWTSMGGIAKQCGARMAGQIAAAR